MKCPHCNQEHPEGTKFCPETGKKMMLCCRNRECANFGEYVIPSNYKFCPECGKPLFCPHCGKNRCECEIEEEHPNNEEVWHEGSEKLLPDNALIVVYDEEEGNEYSNSEDEPKIVTVYSFADGTPKVILEGTYKKPYEYGKDEENGHDVLALEHWDEFKFDEISVLEVKKDLDYSQTVRDNKNERRDNERCERHGFEVLSEDFLLKRCYSDDNLVDIYDRKTRRILLKKAIDNEGTYILRDWCLVAGNDGDKLEDAVYTLLNKDYKIRLKPIEFVLDARDAWTDSEKDAFISENRIISCVEMTSGTYDEINIRDYQGKLIKSFPHPEIYIKCPYKFGKALGFRMADELAPTELIYLDLSGNIHTIPYSVDHIGNAYKTRCWFVTGDTICITDEDYNNKLIDIEGNIVFDFDEDEGSISYLGDNYLEYRDYHNGKSGIIDGHGNIVLKPQFDQVWHGVLR